MLNAPDVDSVAIDAPVPRSLAEIFITSFLRSKWFILVGLIAGVISGYLFLLLKEPVYRVSMTVVSASSGSDGMGLQQMGVSGGASSKLLDFGLGQKENLSKFNMAVELVESARLAAVLEEKYQISRTLLRLRQNPQTGAWERPRSMLSYLSPRSPTPVGIDLITEALKKRVTVDAGKAGVVEMSSIDPDPAFSRDLLQHVYEEVEAIMIHDAKDQTEKSVQYLRDTIGNIQNAENKNILISLLRDTERSLMLLKVGSPYAWKQLDKPYVPVVIYSPKAGTALMIAVGGGVLFWCLAELFAFVRRRKAE